MARLVLPWPVPPGGAGLGSATRSGFAATDFTIGTSISDYDFSFGLMGNLLQVTASLSAVPEPATAVVWFGVLALEAVMERRRRRVSRARLGLELGQRVALEDADRATQSAHIPVGRI